MFDGIEHGKVVTLNYRLGYKHFSSAIARIKNAIAGYNFDQPSSPPLAVIGERVKMKNEKRNSRKRSKEISIKTNAPKITNSTCTSKCRKYIRKFIKRN